MLKVAITGNIASGKSVVENLLLEKGYKVYDTDKIAHEILNTSELVRTKFKNYDILTDNKIDRNKLAKIVFSDPVKLKMLEEIIHPLVKYELNKIFQENFEIVFVSVPQLYEAHFEKFFDKVILVTADETVRLRRLMKRNSLTEEEASRRIQSQLPQEEKITKADFIIDNNALISDIEVQVQKFIDKFICHYN